MKNSILLLILTFLANGCGAVPFHETEPAPLPPGEPRSVVERFEAALPASFQLLSTVVFEYNWRTFSGIGYLDINTADKAFKVVCLNPMGVKLFELSGDRNSVATHYTIADFTRYGDVAAAVAGDIRRIYFDLVPAREATVRKSACRLKFRQPSGAGHLEYVFAGPRGDLIEKNYYDESGLAWRVAYYEYLEQNGKRVPQGIVLLHYDYRYRLTVRQKEFHF